MSCGLRYVAGLARSLWRLPGRSSQGVDGASSVGARRCMSFRCLPCGGASRQESCSELPNGIEMALKTTIPRENQQTDRRAPSPPPERARQVRPAILHELQTDARLTNAELAHASACRPRPAGGACGRWKRRATSRATAPRSTATRSAWACWPSCGSTPSATPATPPASWKTRSANCPRSSPATTSAAPAPSSCRWWRTDLDAFSRFALETLINLPNVKDLHTSFSLGEVKASARCRSLTCRPAGRVAEPRRRPRLMSSSPFADWCSAPIPTSACASCSAASPCCWCWAAW